MTDPEFLMARIHQEYHSMDRPQGMMFPAMVSSVALYMSAIERCMELVVSPSNYGMVLKLRW